jgi:hypothetical protein
MFQTNYILQVIGNKIYCSFLLLTIFTLQCDKKISDIFFLYFKQPVTGNPEPDWNIIKRNQ